MKNTVSSYIGTKRPIVITESKFNNKLKKTESRKFYQVNLVFGGNFNISARENNTLSKQESAKVSKYFQEHGAEIVAKALAS